LTLVASKQIPLTLGQLLIAWLGFLCLPGEVVAQVTTPVTEQDTTKNQIYRSNRKPTFRLKDRYGDPFSNTSTESPLFLKDPNQMKLDVEIDTALNYTIYEKIGALNYRPTSSMSFGEFKQYQDRQQLKSYWQGRSRAQDGESAVSGRGLIPKIFISPVFDRIFGGNYVELVPTGFVTLDLGGQWQRINNPNIPIRQQKNGGFEFDQQINMSVIGKIGEKLAVSANFDNNNSFDFQNNMKVEYTGFKEDILQKLEIGNVSLPLNNTLIQGAQNLFGVKAQLQFGKVNVTAIATTQRGKSSSIDIGGGGGGNTGQGRPFEIIASNYDENRHFFLGQFFRDNYSKWIGNPPQINSGVNITRVEVYIINRNNDTQTLRNVVGLMDLGEPVRIYNDYIGGINATSPNANAANNLFASVKTVNRDALGINDEMENLYGSGTLVNGTDFEKMAQARKLAPTEFTYHKQLGYITLTRKLQNDEALAVAYEYTYSNGPGGSFKVGELSEDYANLKDDEVIFLKMLRPRKVSIRDPLTKEIIPTWDLMMKNIYNLNVNQLTREGFQLRIIYRDDRTGIDNPQLQDGSSQLRDRQLIEILGLDKLNPVNDPQRDGNFDFIDGITINTTTGLIIFPDTEPFSNSLRKAFANEPTKNALIQKYSYDTLYHTTKAAAELYATKNKFYIKGLYNAGSSREILIPGFGVSQGSVKVYAGGIPLNDLTDYVVDYTFGKITILNESILSSGKNIEVKFETADPFTYQTRSLLGTRIDYRPSDDISLGSTFLYYNERPAISRNQIGTEPARNFQYGVDFNINKKSRLLTKIIDALPIIQTKEQSTIVASGEFAQLLPGTSNKIDGEGTAYLDDFENSATPYSLINANAWKLAAPPTKDDRFDKTLGQQNNIEAGYLRSKLAWYTIDNQFYRSASRFKPDNITEADLQNHYVRGVNPQEIFQNRQNYQGVFFEQIFDVAYYPRERGPYNYNTELDEDGLFDIEKAEEKWGGITSAIRTEVDFDKANIEYVEFWLLDPFITTDKGLIDDGINTPKHATAGKLIFQLGSISEDVARDGQHAFENGLPPNGDSTAANRTNWGYVTNQQYLTNSFDDNSGARANQDVGHDGMPDEKEVAFFNESYLDGLNPDAKAIVINDPSGDDFRYFLDSQYDDDEAQLLERYKNINGHDGNSPIITGSDVATPSGTSIPDNEDLNADNTLSELEEYYEYDIDLDPTKLGIGKEYITDQVLTTDDNAAKEKVTWYQFRIPVRQFEKQVGEIDGFKSIKYVRMILTGYKDPIVLRFANFRLVGSRWRRYEGNLLEDGFGTTPETSPDNFVVSVVNLEENGGQPAVGSGSVKEKSPYRIPPGVVRDRDNTSTVNRQLNEQSVQVCIDDLEDGDARAIYKNVSADLFNYGRVKMFFHANSESPDSAMSAFLRLGTDFDQNYYEIEIPLLITRPAYTTEPSEIWPAGNEIDLDLNELYALKVERDRGGFSLSESYPLTGPKKVGRHRIRIFGRPDLSSVQLMMIGVKNPRSGDKRKHSVCLWANELRLTEFNRTPGWAVNATLSAKLADFATVTGSFRHTTFGFGGVSSKIFERTREETTAYDVSTQVNLDKLIPGNSGLKIPMFLSYQNTTSNPGYDPANPDIKLSALEKSFGDSEERSNYLKLIQDVEKRRSLNFVNVRKVKTKADAKTHIYDIENFALSYSFSDRLRTNFTTAESKQVDQKGSISYNFSPKATGIEPFKNSKALSSPWLKLIKDFNFSLMPSNLSVRFDLDRSFGKNIYRNDGGSLSTPAYLKYFTFNRQYNMRWNLTKALSLEYGARAFAIIDEPNGDIDTQEKKDSVLNNLKKFGRMKNFEQNITLNYTLPFDKIPVTDWIGADYRYLVNYNWKAGPVNIPDANVKPGDQDIPDEFDFKNTIQNSKSQNITGRIDLLKLYNKVAFLKKINTPPKPQPVRKSNNPTVKPPPDTVRQTPAFIKGLAKLIMSVQSINGSYEKTEGTILPGYSGTPKYFGMDENWKTPGWGFLLGDQNPNIRYDLANAGYITRNSSITTPFTQTRNENFNLRANIQPTTDLKIQIDLKKEVTNSYQEIFRYNDNDSLQSLNPNRSGSYRISYNTVKTAFEKTNDEIESRVFKTFEENLIVIKQRLDFVNPQSIEYDLTAQDVVIPAFIAAYSGKDVKNVSLSPFQKTPLPNWRLDYTGLNKLNGFKDLFQSVTISHAYQGTYSVSNYSNSLEFDSDEDKDNLSIDQSVQDYNSSYFGKVVDGKLIPVYIISQVLISEQFSPLVGISIRTKSRLTANFQYKTKRDLALNISNAQITELSSKDVSLEMGYTKTGMRLPFKSQGRLIVLKNDFTFRLNFTISDQKTVQRKVNELNIITNGNVNYQLRPNINYTVSQKLSLQMYYERTINNPVISSSYRRTTTRFGVQVRFSLAQ